MRFGTSIKRIYNIVIIEKLYQTCLIVEVGNYKNSDLVDQKYFSYKSTSLKNQWSQRSQ